MNDTPTPEPALSDPTAAVPTTGLIAWLEQTRIALPLKGVEARFEVVGETAHVEIDQIYHQSARQPLDCLYTFPLPARAAVHRCEFHLNGRVIRARIEERHEAQRQFAEAKAQGRRAGLVEADRPNLFQLRLANVQPDDLIVVRLAYVQPVERVGTEQRLRLPFCPGTRYIPGQPLLQPNVGRGTTDDTDQVPDASRLNPPRIDRLHPDAAYLSVQGVLRVAATELHRVHSPSHPLKLDPATDRTAIVLDTGDAVPDQDLVVAWELKPAVQLAPQTWTTTLDDTAYALVQLRAPTDSTTAARAPLDLYFLLDRSGSMSGLKWDRACDAFAACLEPLGPTDRVWATCFESSVHDLADHPLPAPEMRERWPAEHLRQLGTNGGTELLPALQHVLKKLGRHSRQRSTIIVLITDGQVGNEAAIRKALERHPRVVLHAFGLDTVVNDALLEQITRQQRGRAVFLRPDEDVVAAVRRLGHLLNRPVLTQLEATSGWETADGPLPDLYAGELATAVLRAAPGAAPLEVHGQQPDGTRVGLLLHPQPTDTPAVALLWARRRLEVLEARGDTDAAIGLSKQFNLVGRDTAFVAWDEQEQAVVATQEIYQPALEERLWADQRAAMRPVACLAMRTIEQPDEDLPNPAWLRQAHLEAEAEASIHQQIMRYCAPPSPAALQRALKAETQRILNQQLARRRTAERPQPQLELEAWIEALSHHPAFSGSDGTRVIGCLQAWLARPAADTPTDLRRLRTLWEPIDLNPSLTPTGKLVAFARDLTQLVGDHGPYAEELAEILRALPPKPA